MKKSRVILVIGILLAICTGYVLRLVKLQLIDGASYLEQSMNRVVSKSTLPAVRGEILDRYCRPLVTNTSSLSVEINLVACPDLNGTIAALEGLFEEYGEDYRDTFPISAEQPFLYTTTDFSTVFRNFVEKRDGSLDQTADQVLDSLIQYYKLTDLPKEQARNVIAVRYEIERASGGSFYTFAEDVSLPLVTAVRERASKLRGVVVTMASTRNYTEENFASHILGYLGKMDSAEVDSYVEKGYSMNELVGKAGIENICESYLRGTAGTRYTEVDVTGTVTGILKDDAAKSGNDVILTLDKNLQEITENSLEKTIASIRAQNGEASAKSGAAIFMDIETGEILSMASWPDYNLSTFYEDFDTLSKDEGHPYVNRVISGTFPPGSTYKIVTAIAGLEEGVITENTLYTCTGQYTYYEQYQPSCIDYTAHGTINVTQALQKSCNCFFYDIGRQIGSDKLAEYAKKLGFGSLTGIDLKNEVPGIVACESWRNAQGREWNRGEDLLAAIGQTDNAATPIQLLSAVATVANNGISVQPHLIKSILNRETGESVTESSSTVFSVPGISQKTLDIVRRGMEMVTEQGGSAYSAFLDFSVVSVAVKTGTSEVSNGLPTALMVGYAPAENPKIAFAVVIENGGRNVNSYTASVVKDGLSYYFSNLDAFDSVPLPGELVP